VSYVKTLNSTNSRNYEKTLETLQIGIPNVPLTAESIEQGRQIYFKFECDACHGPNARGEAPDFEAKDLKDNVGMPIRPADLDMTNLYSFKNGAAARDIFRTLMTGLNGTPMPSYADAFARREDDAWHLVHYILSLSQRPKPSF
jgi:cytochrome c